MKHRIAALSLIPICSAALLSACFPVYKTTLPSAQATVLDEMGQPISGAEVALVTGSYPYGWERGRERKMTDDQGLATFDGQHDLRVETLMIHGVTYYFWDWCIRKEGYTTYLTGKNGVVFQKNLKVKLTPGQSVACPERPMNPTRAASPTSPTSP